MNSQLAFIDTETTGLDPDWNPIWEVPSSSTTSSTCGSRDSR